MATSPSSSSSCSVDSIMSACSLDSPIFQRLPLSVELPPRRALSLEVPMPFRRQLGRNQQRRVRFDMNQTTFHTIPHRLAASTRSYNNDHRDGRDEDGNNDTETSPNHRARSLPSSPSPSMDEEQEDTASGAGLGREKSTGALVDEALRCLDADDQCLVVSAVSNLGQRSGKRRFRRQLRRKSQYSYPPIQDASGTKALVLDDAFQAWLNTEGSSTSTSSSTSDTKVATTNKSYQDGNIYSSPSSSSSVPPVYGKDHFDEHITMLSTQFLNNIIPGEDTRTVPRDLPPLQPKSNHEYENSSINFPLHNVQEHCEQQQQQQQLGSLKDDESISLCFDDFAIGEESTSKSLLNMFVPPAAKQRDVAPHPPRRRRSSSSSQDG